MLQRGFGQNRYLTALALKKRGDAAAARATFLQGIAVQKELLAVDPGNTRFRRDLSWSLTDLAHVLWNSGEKQAALESYRETLAISLSLAAADPKSVDARVSLAMAHGNLGGALVQLKEPGEGLRNLSEAVTLYESVAAGDPSNAWVAAMLAETYASTAKVHAARSDAASLEAACGLFRKSVQSFEQLKAAGRLMNYREPSLVSARAALAACEARLSGPAQLKRGKG